MLPLIFLVDDDIEGSNDLARILKQNHYGVISFNSPTDVIRDAELRRPSLFLVSGPMKPQSGIGLCVAIRQHASLAATPVILMSGRDSEDDRVLGLELGADDFVTKPVAPRELVARINAVLRRHAHREARARVRLGEIEVDTERFILSVRGEPVDATATQVRLVEYFMRNEGRVFSRDQILDAVWSNSRFVTPRTIDVHIVRIRQMIERNPAKPAYLQTVRGAGYRFTGPNCARIAKSGSRPKWQRAPVFSNPATFDSALATQNIMPAVS